MSSFFSSPYHTTVWATVTPLKVQLEPPGAWVSAGQQTSFRCRVVGSSPSPVVQWWLGGRRLTTNSPLVSRYNYLHGRNYSGTSETQSSLLQLIHSFDLEEGYWFSFMNDVYCAKLNAITSNYHSGTYKTIQL